MKHELTSILTPTQVVETFYKYGNRKDPGKFMAIYDLEEAIKHCSSNSHIWFQDAHDRNCVRQAKVNGKVRTWKRDKDRIEIPLKYGLYEYVVFTKYDIQSGRLLKEVEDN